jgi:hypothetical protein
VSICIFCTTFASSKATLALLSGQGVLYKCTVLNPGKGVCTDPVERGAILEVEGPGPPSGDSERQLSPDREGGKT